jgi:hypothetical protein
MWWIKRKAMEKGLEANKMAQEIANQAYRADVNAKLIWLALVGCLLVFLFTYKPETAQITTSPPQDTIPAVKPNSHKHEVWNPNDPCYKKK